MAATARNMTRKSATPCLWIPRLRSGGFWAPRCVCRLTLIESLLMVGKAPIFEHCCPHCQLLCFFGSQALDRSIRTSLGGLQSTFSLHPPQNLQVKSLTCPFDWVVRWLTISSFALTMAYWVVMGLDGLDFFPSDGFRLDGLQILLDGSQFPFLR